MSEHELVSMLVNKLRREGFRVTTEVSNMGQSADVVAIKGRWVTVVEVKAQNWARAIQQCRAHEQIADFVCVAIASASVSKRLEKFVEEAGYGLLHYSREQHDFEWVIRPQQNKGVWRPQRRHWSRSRRRFGYAD